MYLILGLKISNLSGNARAHGYANGTLLRFGSNKKQPTEIVQKLSWQCSVDRVIYGWHVNE